MGRISFIIWQLSIVASVAGVTGWMLFGWVHGLNLTIYGAVVGSLLTLKATNEGRKTLAEIEEEREQHEQRRAR